METVNGSAAMKFFRVLGGVLRFLFGLMVVAAMIAKLTLPSPQQRWQQQQQESQQTRETWQRYEQQHEQDALREIEEQQRQQERETFRRLAEDLQRMQYDTKPAP